MSARCGGRCQAGSLKCKAIVFSGVVCYNVHIMNIDHYEFILQTAGFEPAGPDVWGKLAGEATAFVEVTASETSAWLYAPDIEQVLGPKLRIAGEPDRAVPEALFQLQALAAQEEACGDVARAFPESAQEEVHAV